MKELNTGLWSTFLSYILVGSDTSYCDVGGRSVEWSNQLPECIGEYRPVHRPLGSWARPACLLTPFLTLFVIVAKCGPPPDISNGRHSGRNKEFYTYGSSVTYSCNSPFSLIGTASISCSVDNKTQSIWTPNPPACKSKSHSWFLIQIVGFR